MQVARENTTNKQRNYPKVMAIFRIGIVLIDCAYILNGSQVFCDVTNTTWLPPKISQRQQQTQTARGYRERKGLRGGYSPPTVLFFPKALPSSLSPLPSHFRDPYQNLALPPPPPPYSARPLGYAFRSVLLTL